jgi:hypothetical protein
MDQMRTENELSRVEKEQIFALLAKMVARYGSLKTQAANKRGTATGLDCHNEAADQYRDILVELGTLVDVKPVDMANRFRSS